MIKMTMKIFIVSFALDLMHLKLLNHLVYKRRYYNYLVNSLDFNAIITQTKPMFSKGMSK